MRAANGFGVFALRRAAQRRDREVPDARQRLFRVLAGAEVRRTKFIDRLGTLLLEAVAIILGRHHARTKEGTEARLPVLGPVLKQNVAIGPYHNLERELDRL